MTRLKKIFGSLMVVCLVAISASPVFADEAHGSGYVEPYPFLDLAGEEDLTVEVSLKGALLRLLSAVFSGEDEEMADMVAQLEAIQAVIVDMSKPAKLESGVKLLQETLRKLQRKGWDRLAVVKEDDIHLTVLVKAEDDTINGLVVLIHEKTEQQLIFVNIAGRIDLAKLEALGKELDIPGLDQVPRKDK